MAFLLGEEWGDQMWFENLLSPREKNSS